MAPPSAGAERPPPAPTAVPAASYGPARADRSSYVPPHLRNRSLAQAPPASSASLPSAAPGLLGRSSSGMGGRFMGGGTSAAPPRRWDRELNPFGNEQVAPPEPEAFDEHQNTGINFDAYEDIIAETRGREVPPAVGTFAEMNLGAALNENIRRCKYVRLNPMQRHAIPISLAGRDLMACAQTGSGRTAAFCFPIISGIMVGPLVQRPQRSGSRTACPLALILAPTRELSIKILKESKKFSYQTGVKVVVAHGGAPISQQLRDLERGVDILVATPGRLVDLLEMARVSLQSIRYLVLDEADRMLDMGFEPQVRSIVEHMDMPPRGVRQTSLFSATFPGEIQRMASDFLENYIFLAVGRVGLSNELITQRVDFVQETDKRSHLMDLLHAQRDSSDRRKEMYGPKGQKVVHGMTNRPKPNANVDIRIGLSTWLPWKCSLCNFNANCEAHLSQHANGRLHREAVIAYRDSQNDMKSHASQSVVIVKSLKAPVTQQHGNAPFYKSCHGIIINASPDIVHIAVHQSNIDPGDKDIVLVCFYDQQIKAAKFLINETVRFRILQIEITNHHYHPVKSSDFKIGRKDIFLYWNFGQNNLLTSSSSIINTSTAGVNCSTGDKITLDENDDLFTFACKEDIKHILGAPVFNFDGLLVGMVNGNHSTIQIEDEDSGHDLIYAHHAVTFIPILLKNIKAYSLKGQSRAHGKPDKRKPNADIDISVGLSTQSPWFCSLCHIMTTSNKSLLEHADGWKHRARATAYQASRKVADSEGGVGKHALKRKRTDKEQLKSLLTEKIASSSRFSVEGKNIRFASKNKG